MRQPQGRVRRELRTLSSAQALVIIIIIIIIIVAVDSIMLHVTDAV